MFRTLIATVKIQFLEMTAYRSSVLIWSVTDAIYPLSFIVIWLLVYQGQSTVGGLNESQMLVYYVGVLLVTTMVNTHIEWDIQDDIRTGRLKQFLTKPLPFALYQATAMLAWRVYAAALSIPLSFFIIWWLNHSLSLGAPYPLSWQFILSLIGSLGIFMSMSFCLGFIAFFLERATGFFHANDQLRTIASGGILPLALFPPWAQTISQWLPYSYQYDFPIRVLLGDVTTSQFWIGVETQAGWTVLFALFALGLWELGVRRYDAPEQVGVAGAEI